MPEIRGLTEVVIWVHNMEESLHFYRDLLGLTVMSPPDFRGAVFLTSRATSGQSAPADRAGAATPRRSRLSW